MFATTNATKMRYRSVAFCCTPTSRNNAVVQTRCARIQPSKPIQAHEQANPRTHPSSRSKSSLVKILLHDPKRRVLNVVPIDQDAPSRNVHNDHACDSNISATPQRVPPERELIHLHLERLVAEATARLVQSHAAQAQHVGARRGQGEPVPGAAPLALAPVTQAAIDERELVVVAHPRGRRSGVKRHDLKQNVRAQNSCSASTQTHTHLHTETTTLLALLESMGIV